MRKYKTNELIPFTDDIMFSLVMQDENICREFLKRILPDEDFGEITVNGLDINLNVSSQKTIKLSPNSRGVRLDAFIKTKNVWAEIEMQTYMGEDIPKRCRYYHANMDLDYLKEGQSYRKLPHSYVIFICTYDYFNTGEPVQKFQVMDPKNGLPLGDESYTIILNTACNKECVPKELSALFEYINDPQNVSDDRLVEDINRQVQLFNTDDWRHKQMTLGELMDRNYEQGLQKGIEQGIEQGVEQGIAQGRSNAMMELAKTMKDNNEPMEKIQYYTGLTKEEVDKI